MRKAGVDPLSPFTSPVEAVALFFKTEKVIAGGLIR